MFLLTYIHHFGAGRKKPTNGIGLLGKDCGQIMSLALDCCFKSNNWLRKLLSWDGNSLADILIHDVKLQRCLAVKRIDTLIKQEVGACQLIKQPQRGRGSADKTEPLLKLQAAVGLNVIDMNWNVGMWHIYI